MQQFLVPQFIDVEDKIIGPITVRQFVLMLVGALMLFITYKLADFTLFLILGIFEVALIGILGFAKINGRPIHYFLLNFAQTFKRPRLRVWNKEAFVKEAYYVKEEIIKAGKKYTKSPVTSSRLSDLALVINTGGVYGGEESPGIGDDSGENLNEKVNQKMKQSLESKK